MWRGRYGWTQNMERISEKGASHLVPFILKLGGRRDHIVLDRPFSNIVSSDLAIAVLNGQISTAAQASDWLARRAADSENSMKYPAPAGSSAAR